MAPSFCIVNNRTEATSEKKGCTFYWGGQVHGRMAAGEAANRGPKAFASPILQLKSSPVWPDGGILLVVKIFRPQNPLPP